MKKKYIIVSILAILTIFSMSFCFAAEDNNSENNKETNLGNQITESMNKAGQNAENVIEDVTGNKNTVDNMKNTMGDMADGIKGAAQSVGNTASDAMNYTTSRTSTTADQTNNTNSTWTWIIIAVVAVAIIGLVWYYAMQNTDER